MGEKIHSGMSGFRVVFMWGMLLLVAVVASMSVPNLPEGGFSTVVAFALGFILTPVLASPIEWLVHSYVYHKPVLKPLRRIYAVHLAHHHLYFPTWRYVTGGAARRIPIFANDVLEVCTSDLRNALIRTAHFIFYFALGLALIVLPGWLITSSPPFLVGSLASLAVISNLFITVHDAIHRPESHAFMQRQGWFRFLDEHHYIHHVDERCNVNFLLPLADLLFGTLRTSLTEEEVRAHGSREMAKRRIEGTGEPARRPQTGQSAFQEQAT